jgi:hypothetical protein
MHSPVLPGEWNRGLLRQEAKALVLFSSPRPTDRGTLPYHLFGRRESFFKIFSIGIRGLPVGEHCSIAAPELFTILRRVPETVHAPLS